MSATSDALSARDFERLSSFVYSECGIRLPPEKRTMLEGRIRKRLRSLGIGSCSEYTAYLFGPDGPSEVPLLIDVVTTNKTDFFREPRHFEYLAAMALPELMRLQEPDSSRPLLAWSAGCSTGEEPYTLAMVLSEHAARFGGLRFRLLATDISTRVLEHAARAIYPAEAIAPVPGALRSKYLLRSRNTEMPQFRIAPELRALVEFRRLNLMDRDFGIQEAMDVVFCRNVIIYFDRRTQAGLLERLCGQLRPGGYLFLGHSETLTGLDLPLAPVGPTVYRKAVRHASG